jgi:hypothetical protein
MNLHRSVLVVPGTRLVVAIAPELTIGFVRPSGPCSIAVSELNGRPVAFTPSNSRAGSAPIASHTSAKTNGFETLMIAKGTLASPAAYTLPLALTTQTPKHVPSARARAG